MASFAMEMRHALARCLGFLQYSSARHYCILALAYRRPVCISISALDGVGGTRRSSNCNKILFSRESQIVREEEQTAARNKRRFSKDCKAQDVSYEPYWCEAKVQDIEKNHPGMIIRGTVVIPAFATSEARVMVHEANIVTREAGTRHQGPKKDRIVSQFHNVKHTDGYLPSSVDGSECQRASDPDAILDAEVDCKNQEPGYMKTKAVISKKGVPIFGFLSRNRAFHGDEVIGIRQRRYRELGQEHNPALPITEQCRIIRITRRSEALSSFVAVLDADACARSSDSFRCQPQDTRWPAFIVRKADVAPEVLKQVETFGTGAKVFCLLRFDGWKENDVEPAGSIIRIIGDVADPDSQMEASMIFYGLNPNGFSEDVIDELNRLIEQAEGTKEENRMDYRDHLVFTIDPQDAKDLDDALSVEILEDTSGKYRYRVGVHIADVSHYVRGGTLVDLDARKRATSVYLEHKVFPMLPHPLSENLCSLLPKSEKLCFSMFAELEEGPSEGDLVGSNLYIKNQSFVLTRIVSRRRLSYNAAKDLIYSHMGDDPDEMTAKMESMSIHDFQKNVVEPIGLLGSTSSPVIIGAESAKKSDEEEIDVSNELEERGNEEAVKGTADRDLVVSLMVLYFISRKLRGFRLKQRGAVTVDTSGNQKCHIPRVGENTGAFWVEQIPTESHELVEEMMLLANTQAAQLLARSFDRYFLRVHENTSKAIKKLISSMIPQELKRMLNPEILSIPELLRKCAKYMQPTAFQSLSFAALQQFKEAVYSPVNNLDKNKTSISGHWGLALPMYLHFTSPIRRYSDLYTHRMLKTVVDGTYTEHSLKVLDEICKQCNLQKRKAFDVQKDYKNFAFNQYLRWACIGENGTEPYAANDPRFARCLNKSKGDTWGMIYEDACIFTIVLHDPKSKDPSNKSSIIFYIPMLAEQRSVSCDALNVVPLEAMVNGEKIQLSNAIKASNTDPMMYGYLKEVKKTAESENDNGVVNSITLRVGETDHITFSQYQRVKVVLIPGSQMWTLRLPSDYKSSR